MTLCSPRDLDVFRGAAAAAAPRSISPNDGRPDRQTDGHAAMGFWRQTPREARKKMGVANHEVSVDLIQLPERFKPLPKIQIGGEARKWILCMSSVQIKLTMARIVDRMTRTFPSRAIPFNFKSATASAQKLWRLPKIQVLNLSSHVRLR